MSHTDKTIEEIKTKLKNGYLEMSDINLEEADLSLEADNAALQLCEEKLTECE